MTVARQIDDEKYRPEALAGVARGYGQLGQFAEVYKLLPTISEDGGLIEGCAAIFERGAAEVDPDQFLLDALYRILPLASQRRRGVYLRIVQRALPFLVEHVAPEQLRPILAFLAEQWGGGPASSPDE